MDDSLLRSTGLRGDGPDGAPGRDLRRAATSFRVDVLASLSPRGGGRYVEEADLREMIVTIDVAAVLDHAEPSDKATVYADLGLTLTYKLSERLVLPEAARCT